VHKLEVRKLEVRKIAAPMCATCERNQFTFNAVKIYCYIAWAHSEQSKCTARGGGMVSKSTRKILFGANPKLKGPTREVPRG
jgi:hypothetical protein